MATRDAGTKVNAAQEDVRATFARLTREHQDHGRELIAAGTRPIDDATYRDRDDRIQALRLRLPAVSLIR